MAMLARHRNKIPSYGKTTYRIRIVLVHGPARIERNNLQLDSIQRNEDNDPALNADMRIGNMPMSTYTDGPRR